MNMQPLYSTPEREIILDYLLDNQNEEINMNALARELDVSPGQVHHYLKILEKSGLFKNKKLIDNAITKSLRLVKNLNFLNQKKIVNFIKRKIKADGIGIYGSWAKGENTKDSDIDIWIKTEKNIKDAGIADINRKLEKKLENQAECLIVTPGRIKHLKKKAPSLYYDLFNSIVLWGKGL